MKNYWYINGKIKNLSGPDIVVHKKYYNNRIVVEYKDYKKVYYYENGFLKKMVINGVEHESF